VGLPLRTRDGGLITRDGRRRAPAAIVPEL